MSSSVQDAVRNALARPTILAVSGGRDSMVLMHAAAEVARERIACVATFDHGTGAAAREAAALVGREARRLELEVVHQRALRRLEGEAEWRAARWAFLGRVARAYRAPVATAHTRDDQVETVLIRVLRGSGARGLAGLYAPGTIVRPLLDLSRDEVAAFARERGIEWAEDPSNESMRHLRNRVRRDLRPALERARPGLGDELLALARRAAALRRRVDEVVAHEISSDCTDGELMVARADLLDYDAPGLGMLWPALVARVGLALDRRGTARLVAFTTRGRNGARVQLSGGWEVALHADHFLVRRARRREHTTAAVPLRGATELGDWRFRPVAADPAELRGDLWSAALPAGRALSVRAWRPGDRIVPHGSGAPRRVKGVLRDAGIDAARRPGWPVVLVDDEIVWIPGVRRSSAATVRSGRPVVLYICERIHVS